MKIRKQHKETIFKLVDVGAPNLWVNFKDEDLKACDEVCGKKRGRKSKGDTRWQNKELKKTSIWKKDAHKAMYQNSTEGNKRRYKSMKNKAKIEVLKAMIGKT